MFLPSLGLFPLRQPACLYPLPRVATSCPRSGPGCKCRVLTSRVLTSRYPCSLSQRWLIPAPGRGCSLMAIRHRCSRFPSSPIPFPHRTLAGAAPSSQARIVDSSPWSRTLWSYSLLPARKPPCLFPLPHVANSCPWWCPRRRCSLCASLHPRDTSPFLPAVLPWLRLFPPGKLLSLSPEPGMANSAPCPGLLPSASRHRSSRSQRLPIPACGCALPWGCPFFASRHPSTRCPT